MTDIIGLEEIQEYIGCETDPETFEIDKTVIKRFAQGLGDANPLWQDEEKARRSHFGGIVAPPSLIFSVQMLGPRPWMPINDRLPARRLDGGSEWEIVRPIRPGDVITVVSRITDVTQRAGRVGPMLTINYESIYRDSQQEEVARVRSTYILY